MLHIDADLYHDKWRVSLPILPHSYFRSRFCARKPSWLHLLVHSADFYLDYDYPQLLRSTITLAVDFERIIVSKCLLTISSNELRNIKSERIGLYRPFKSICWGNICDSISTTAHLTRNRGWIVQCKLLLNRELRARLGSLFEAQNLP
jgi:hypothetical protein